MEVEVNKVWNKKSVKEWLEKEVSDDDLGKVVKEFWRYVVEDNGGMGGERWEKFYDWKSRRGMLYFMEEIKDMYEMLDSLR